MISKKKKKHFACNKIVYKFAQLFYSIRNICERDLATHSLKQTHIESWWFVAYCGTHIYEMYSRCYNYSGRCGQHQQIGGGGVSLFEMCVSAVSELVYWRNVRGQGKMGRVTRANG